MSAGANVRHFSGLLLASVGSTFGLAMAAVFLLVGAQNGEPGSYVCAGLSVVVAAVCVWRGIKMRNRAAKESTIFKEEVDLSVTHTTKSGIAKPSFIKDKKPHRDDW